MDRLTILEIEWNHYNGFIFSVMEIETENFQGELFGIHAAWKEHLLINFCYMTFEIRHPFI